MELWHLLAKYYQTFKKADWYLENFVQIVERTLKEVIPDLEVFFDEYRKRYVFKSESRKGLKTGRDLLDVLFECIPQELFRKRVKNENVVLWLLLFNLFECEVNLTNEEYEEVLKKLKTLVISIEDENTNKEGGQNEKI